MPELNARAIAFYLPQYHPIPENDEWWGKGFTEWTNVTKARPLFKGHYQPHLPADLGFYDLRISEVREQQAIMAKEYGVEGFCYWHYWFGNRRLLLEKPFQIVMDSRQPNFPFCLGWANESWTGVWHGNPDKTLVEQLYPGEQDYIEHFYYLLKAFKDARYLRVDNKPIFYIYRPLAIPDLKSFTRLFRKLATKNGLDGLYIIANSADLSWDPLEHGCDAVNVNLLGDIYKKLPNSNFIWRKIVNQLRKPLGAKIYLRYIKRPLYRFKYKDVISHLIPSTEKQNIFPTVIPNWDNSARSGLNSLILTESTPLLFEQHLNDALRMLSNNESQTKILFIKSWNEWAEGNHLEPDRKFGLAYLKALKRCLTREI